MKEDQASSTAFTVLIGMLHTARNAKFGDLVSDEIRIACEQLLKASPAGQKSLSKLDKWWFNIGVDLAQKALMPSIALHYVLRKRYIEDFTVKAIEQGATQVVNLGAGFDTLALRLAKRDPEVQFIEVDHPATHYPKKESLETAGLLSNNFYQLPVDFNKDDLSESLKKTSYFSSNRKTVFIIEGVLMYLSRKQIELLFASLNDLMSADFHIIFTAIEPISKDINSYKSLLKWYLKIKGEPFEWTCAHQQIEDFLSSIQYNLDEIGTHVEFKKRYLNGFNKRIHEGEYIAVASVNRS